MCAFVLKWGALSVRNSKPFEMSCLQGRVPPLRARGGGRGCDKFLPGVHQAALVGQPEVLAQVSNVPPEVGDVDGDLLFQRVDVRLAHPGVVPLLLLAKDALDQGVVQAAVAALGPVAGRKQCALVLNITETYQTWH